MVTTQRRTRSKEVSWVTTLAFLVLFVVPNAFAFDDQTQSLAVAPRNFNLLEYVRSNLLKDDLATTEKALPKYNRRFHFGGWINEDSPADCLDTRDEVLLRDAVANRVTYKAGSQCEVIKGEWRDVYTGTKFKLATAVQIDHVIPLKHAFVTGAHAWRPASRCHFANFMANDYHLKAVSGRENMAKGGRGPEKYMPPNAKFQCQYLHDWMKIKAIWELAFSAEELTSIEEHLAKSNCKTSFTQISQAELKAQRLAASTPSEVCENFEKTLLMPPETPAP